MTSPNSPHSVFSNRQVLTCEIVAGVAGMELLMGVPERYLGSALMAVDRCPGYESDLLGNFGVSSDVRVPCSFPELLTLGMISRAFQVIYFVAVFDRCAPGSYKEWVPVLRGHSSEIIRQAASEQFCGVLHSERAVGLG